MQIAVDNIHDNGRQVPVNADLAWAVAAAAVALEAQPVTFLGEMLLTVAHRRVTVNAVLRTSAHYDCARCGEGVLQKVEVDEVLTYRPQPTETGAGEVELNSDDLDVAWYANGVLNLDEVLTELIALAMPVRVVCSDAAACSARVDALLQSHRADEEPIGHPAFAVLKDIH